MEELNTTQNTTTLKYTDIFKIIMPEKFIVEQKKRRSGQWEHQFKSLNGYKFQLNIMGENFDIELEKLREQINENNHINFVTELKEIYIPAQIQSEERDNQDDLKTNRLLDQHFNRIEKTDEYRKQRDKAIKYIIACIYNNKDLIQLTIPQNFYDQIDENFDLSRIIVIKILLNEKLNLTEQTLFEKAFNKNKKCLKLLDMDNDLSNYLKLIAIAKSKNIDQKVINDMKIGIYRSCLTSIFNRTMGVDRNSKMEADFFQTIYGLFEILEIVNSFLEKNPENEYSVLFRKYLNLKSNMILSYLNKPELTFEVIITSDHTAHNLKIYGDMMHILSNLLMMKTIIGYVKKTKQVEINDKILVKKLQLEILKESVNSKLQNLNHSLQKKIMRFSEDFPSIIELPDIKDSIKSINNEFIILEENIETEKFFTKLWELEKISDHFDNVCLELNKIKPGLKVEGRQTIDIDSAKSTAQAFSNLKKTLEDGNMYHSGIKIFVDKILEFFRRLFGKGETLIHTVSKNETRTRQARSFSIIPNNLTLSHTQGEIQDSKKIQRSNTTTY